MSSAAEKDSTTAPSQGSVNNQGAVLTDSLIVTWRNLKRIPRIPELAAFAILQSVMFVLLFAFVFGGAIPLPGGGSYKEFLMPGIFAQTLTFAAATTAIGMTDDMAKGLIDRFRSLPMARSAFITGRTVSDVVYNAGILIVLMVSGLAVGWRIREGVAMFLAGFALALLFAYAMSWLGVWLGMLVPTVEVAQQVVFTAIFPLTFVSNAFVPLETLPSWLRTFAEWQPVSAITSALRDLFGNPNPYASDSFPANHSVLLTLIWVVIIVAIFAPLGTRRYKATSR